MPSNSAGAYQPFGSGWNNLSNYLTRSNLGAIDKDKSGAGFSERYKNPDAGSSFDDWLSAIGKKDSKVEGVQDASPPPLPMDTPPTTRRTATPQARNPADDETDSPASQMAERKRSWQEERNDNPYSRFNGYY